MLEETEPIGDARAGRPTAAPAVSGLSATGARLTRLVVRALVVAAAGVMAAGFLGWEAGALVAGLAVLTYILLATLAPRAPAPYGTGRLLRPLRRHGYYIISVPEGVPGGSRSRYLAVGPGGAYLLDTRSWRRAVSWTGAEWRIGGVPARRVLDRLAHHAAALERLLRLRDIHPELVLVPVLVVTARLPAPAMRADRAVIARPRGAVDHIANRPEILDTAEIDSAAADISDRL